MSKSYDDELAFLDFPTVRREPKALKAASANDFVTLEGLVSGVVMPGFYLDLYSDQELAGDFSIAIDAKYFCPFDRVKTMSFNHRDREFVLEMILSEMHTGFLDGLYVKSSKFKFSVQKNADDGAVAIYLPRCRITGPIYPVSSDIYFSPTSIEMVEVNITLNPSLKYRYGGIVP